MKSHIKIDESGLHIPKEMVKDFPPDTVFQIDKKGAQLVLTPEGLTEKTAGIVKYQEIDLDNPFDELISRR